ncbi:hypothetical protein VTK73DRAFT_6112 [Phialemonium thermophilum]|uniref:Uncharacterized protein n=1 Tax=Phialemonium thermophilum TaxID=223376 RepID=A0ABR3V014_9PEZI
MAAFQALYELVEEDRDFQRIVFQGLTTDEKIKFGVHTTEELDFVGYDLGLPLHDLVARKRWVTPISRGFAPDEPRYLYNLFGRRGEYCADDEFLWAALQPALQLVSHVLSINHPFWLAALDVMSRVPVDPSRNRYGAVGDPMVAIWRDLAQPTLPNERAFFQSIGFDARRAAAHFLQERLVLDIACSFRDPFSKAPSSHWGMTGYEHYEDPRRRTVAVHISADMLWPLLVPTFTQAEKASVSLMVASTLLHELSVGFFPS